METNINELVASIRDRVGRTTEPVEELRLPEPAGQLWNRVHSIVSRTFKGKGKYRLGGGTLLAARWKHRVSIDIDLSIEPKGRAPQRIANWIDEGSSFRKELERLGCGKPVALSWYQIRIPFKESTLDISVLDAYPSTGEHVASVNGKRTVVLSTTQVLGGKLARPEKLLHRDAYDIRHAAQVEKQSLAKALNGMERSEAGKIIRTWNRLEGHWAALAPSQLQIVVPKHTYEPATLAAETAEALRDALYQHVRITTHGRRGTFYAETVGGTSVQVSFTRRSLLETLNQHGIKDYLSNQSRDPDNVELIERIKKACRFGARQKTVYEKSHKRLELEARRPRTRTAGVGSTPARPGVNIEESTKRTGRHKRGADQGHTR